MERVTAGLGGLQELRGVILSPGRVLRLLHPESLWSKCGRVSAWGLWLHSATVHRSALTVLAWSQL